MLPLSPTKQEYSSRFPLKKFIDKKSSFKLRRNSEIIVSGCIIGNSSSLKFLELGLSNSKKIPTNLWSTYPQISQNPTYERIPEP